MLKWYGNRCSGLIERHMRSNLERAGAKLEADIKRRFGPKGTHAGPGEIPHVQSGTLKRAVAHKVEKPAARSPVCKVGIMKATTPASEAEALVYALPLEIGYVGRDGGKKGPYPYLRPGLDRNRAMIKKELTRPLIG